MKKPKSRDGIISYLAKRYGGNVYDKGIIAITSKSIDVDDPQNAPNQLASGTHSFMSKNEPGQWVCWDFGQMRVRPFGYTITALFLKSWIVQGSVTGRKWTMIDRQMDNQVFRYGAETASFRFSSPSDFRFIRLTQIHKNHSDLDFLILSAVEFFGILFQ
jgi:hypothetical protein